MAPDTRFDELGSRLAAVRADLAGERLESAEALSRSALLGGFEHPLFLNVAAFGLERAGRLDDAMRLLQRALELDGDDPTTLNALGHWYSKAARPQDAREAFEAALSRDPGFASAHHGLGLALAAQKDFAGARAAQLRALEHGLNSADVLGALSGVSANLDLSDDARRYAAQALALEPENPVALVALGALELQAGQPELAAQAAAGALRGDRLTGFHASAAHRLLADARDALGEYGDAFDHYAAANAILRNVYHGVHVLNGHETGPQMCARLADAFRPLRPGDWTTPLPVGERDVGLAAGHVFLVGFPRSGTTLLEQVLATHPAVVALEERQTLDEVGLDYFDRDTLPRLFDMEGDTARALRRRYWDNVRAFGVEPAGRVFVDKHPLDSLWIPYIAKVFPGARILFARRDPRDVVLSCFRRRFLMNGAMFTFTDLLHAAHFYAGVMQLAELYRGMCDLPWRDHRHERLVADFEGETRGLCDFLGLEWTPALAGFAETAKRRDVQTPSAPQVRRGLSTEGLGQWRRYAGGMAVALPILQPWVERLGYPAD